MQYSPRLLFQAALNRYHVSLPTEPIGSIPRPPALLWPRLFELKVGNFRVGLAGESDRELVLGIIRRCKI